MRALLMAVLILVGMGGTAEARRGGGIAIIVTGDDIEHLRDLSAEQAALLGYGKLGYHYDRFGLFWLDLWRSGGEFVVYDGDVYVPLTAEEVELLGGASVPWRYHLPPLLLVILVAIELFVVGRRKRSVKLGFYAGGALIAIAALLYFKGLTWEFLIPGLAGVYHVLASHRAMRAPVEDDAADEIGAAHSGAFATTSGVHRAATAPTRSSGPLATDGTPVRKSGPLGTREGTHRAAPPAARRSGPLATPSPSSSHGAGHAGAPDAPARPSQPIVIERPSQPAAVPMRPDDTAEGPKLLR